MPSNKSKYIISARTSRGTVLVKDQQGNPVSHAEVHIKL